jgi:hypothetical protein
LLLVGQSVRGISDSDLRGRASKLALTAGVSPEISIEHREIDGT